MTQEKKQLLLKDLCARLPYGVKCVFPSKKGDIPSTIVKVDIENQTITHKPDGQLLMYFYWLDSGNIKIYLRPMSSMTEEEREELSCYENDIQRVDFYYSHHIDCRFMIEKDIALEAPDGMYKTE